MPPHPAMKVAAAHKRNVENCLADVLSDAGVKNASSMARQVAILLGGAFSTMLVHIDVDCITPAGAAAKVLVKAQSYSSMS